MSAVPLYVAAIEAGEESELALASLIYCLAQESRPDLALQYFEKYNIDAPVVRYELLEIAVLRQDVRLALECAESAMILPGAEATIQYRLGVLWGRELENQKALDCFERALLLNPNHSNSASGKAMALSRLGRVDEAVQYLQLRLDGDPRNPQLLHGVSMVERGRGNFQAAQAAARKMLSIDPTSNRARVELALAHYGKGEWLEALEVADLELAMSPNNLDALYVKALSLVRLEQYEAASEVYRTFRKLNPHRRYAIEHVQVLLQLARMGDQLERHLEEASQICAQFELQEKDLT